MGVIKIIVKFYVTLIKSKMEYRFNFFMEIFINIFTYILSYMGIWIILDKFQTINGWNYYEVMLLYNFNLVTYGLASFLFYNPMRSLDNIVKSGDFDSMLTKPINPFLYTLLKQSYLGFLGHIFLGITVFMICFDKLDINWSIDKFILFLIMLVGGTLIQASIMIFSGALSLKFLQATAVMDTLIYSVRKFIEYPIEIYDKYIQIMLVFIVPYAFVSFFPAEYLLGKQDNLIPLTLLKFGTIMIGCIMFYISYLFFMSSINKYQSTGS